MFKPVQMKRFYLAIPIEYEEESIRKIGEIGVAQITRDIAVEHSERSEVMEICRKFIRSHDRIKAITTGLPAKQKAEVSRETSREFNLAQIRELLELVRIDEFINAIEKAESDIKNLKVLEERLVFLEKNGLRTDEVGNFKNIFVKVGFLKNSFLSRIDTYLNGTSATYISKNGRIGENLLVTVGLNEDESLVESSLKLLNFEEFTFPKDLNPEPKIARDTVRESVAQKEKEIKNLKNELLLTRERFDFFESSIQETMLIEEVRSYAARTKKKSLIHGWIPSEKTNALKSGLEEIIPKENIYLKFEEPKPEDNVPVYQKRFGVFASFDIFTNLRGVPNYFEINPTIIYTFLYVSMFGLMFGDMGDGIVFLALGIMLTRMRKGLLTFSHDATRKLGIVIMSCGLSSIFFGVLDGQFFLNEVIEPVLDPLHNINETISIALVFGVAQITLALGLSIINKVRRKEFVDAILSEHGLIGMTYYLSGVILAIAFIKETNFGVFTQPNIIPFTFVALASLALIFLSPLIKTSLVKKEVRVTEKVIEGFGGGLETFVSFIANSVSFIRLAAFAIAHEALGLAVSIFIPVIGSLPSFILLNLIAFLVEGFAALIQSLRLMYYEFSTKFYIGDGSPYEPFKTVVTKQKT